MGTAAAFLPCYFSLRVSAPGKASDPGISSEFLPAEPGIQQGASRRSHVLVHIDRGHPVMHHFHVPPPEAALRTNREQKAGRPTGPLTSIRRLTHALAAAAGMTGWPRSMCIRTWLRREAPCFIPGSAGRNSEDIPGSDGLPKIRKVKGTIACQESSGRAHALGRGAAGPARYG